MRGIRAGTYYNGDPPVFLRGFINDKVSRIIGHATMRQLRVEKGMYILGGAEKFCRRNGNLITGSLSILNICCVDRRKYDQKVLITMTKQTEWTDDIDNVFWYPQRMKHCQEGRAAFFLTTSQYSVQ